MLNVTVIQPPYFAGENPSEKIADFLLSEAEKAEAGLILMPEYSNAGGVSDKESELAALPRAEKMLSKASEIAKEKGSYVGINVLEKRGGKIYNSTYLFDKNGEVAFVYDKIHLPPSEVTLGVEYGSGACVCEIDGIKFGFMTCYDVYFNEQIEFLAKNKPDIILIPGYQRGERTEIICSQARLTAFRCNAFVVRSSYSMNDDAHGGNSMIVSPNGEILKNIGKEIGSICCEIDEKEKFMRSAGFGGGRVRGDDFINNGLRPEIFK